MKVLVRDVADSDISRSCEIEFLAYKDNPLSPILAPGPFPPDSLKQRVQELIDLRKNDESVKYLQAVDEESGKMIACAKWHVYATEEAAALSSRPLTFAQGRNKEACTAFFGGMAERKKEIVGSKPHVYIHLLHTDPEYQGRGAGSALLKSIAQRADKLGLPTYLESSDVAHRLYQKHGFQDVDVFEVDFGPWGGRLHKQPLMVRAPQISDP